MSEGVAESGYKLLPKSPKNEENVVLFRVRETLTLSALLRNTLADISLNTCIHRTLLSLPIYPRLRLFVLHLDYMRSIVCLD